jgi:hypothetical protein
MIGIEVYVLQAHVALGDASSPTVMIAASIRFRLAGLTCNVYSFPAYFMVIVEDYTPR